MMYGLTRNQESFPDPKNSAVLNL